MNKSMLLKAGLFSLVCLPVFGQTITGPTSQTTPSTNPSPSNPNPTNTVAPVLLPGPVIPATNGTTPPMNPTIASQAPSPLDCNYHISASNSSVDTALVMQWGQKAAQQTFTFDPSTLDAQLNVLKACYTEQGWQSFNDALKKSGNLDAIKKENLTVSSVVDGQATITATKDNQWTVVVPIQVMYQNGQEKIAQSLTINLSISRKVSGDLGIMQIVATPKQATLPTAPTPPNNSSVNTKPMDATSPPTATTLSTPSAAKP